MLVPLTMGAVIRSTDRIRRRGDGDRVLPAAPEVAGGGHLDDRVVHGRDELFVERRAVEVIPHEAAELVEHDVGAARARPRDESGDRIAREVISHENLGVGGDPREDMAAGRPAGEDAGDRGAVAVHVGLVLDEVDAAQAFDRAARHRRVDLRCLEGDELLPDVEHAVVVVVDRDEHLLAEGRGALRVAGGRAVVAVASCDWRRCRASPSRSDIRCPNCSDIRRPRRARDRRSDPSKYVSVSFASALPFPLRSTQSASRREDPVLVDVDPVEGVAVGVEEGRMEDVDARVEIGDAHSLAGKGESRGDRAARHAESASISCALTSRSGKTAGLHAASILMTSLRAATASTASQGRSTAYTGPVWETAPSTRKKSAPSRSKRSYLGGRKDMIEFRGDGDFLGSRRGERRSPVVGFREPGGSRMPQESQRRVELGAFRMEGAGQKGQGEERDGNDSA